jgi:hypothetical protein
LPPWQFVEQQSPLIAHESPSVLHALVPVGVGRAWQVVAQLPVQHSPADEQAVPVALQTVPAQSPETHDCEQHSAASEQAAPGVLQKAVVVQLPALVAPVGLVHEVEQHSPPSVQAAPDALQVETGVAHSSVWGLQ